MRDGLVVVDKAPGWTSHDVVAKLRGVYGQKRIGHAGTLDPDATGVLLVGLGRVTRLMRYLQGATKEYRARVVFGVATDTLDASGVVLERTEMTVTRDALGGCAHLGNLRRLRVAGFPLDDARPIEAVEADPDAAVRPPTEAVRDLECVSVDAERARAVAHGATFAAPALLGDRDGAGPFAVVDDAGVLLAVYERRGGGVKPSVVLATEAINS